MVTSVGIIGFDREKMISFYGRTIQVGEFLYFTQISWENCELFRQHMGSSHDFLTDGASLLDKKDGDI